MEKIEWDALLTQVVISALPTLLGLLGKRSLLAKGEIADAFNQILNESLGHLTDIVTNLANVGLAALLGALSGKRGIFDDLLATLGGHVDNITSSLVSLGGSLWDAVQPSLQDLQDQLTNHALNAAQSLLGTLAGISGTLQG